MNWTLEVVVLPVTDLHFRDGGAYDSFVFFKDPDGNNWAVQEVPPNRPSP